MAEPGDPEPAEASETPDPEVLAVLKRPAKRSRRRVLIGGAAVVLLLALILWLLLGGRGETYEAIPATTGPFVREVTAVGTIEPLEQIDISSRQSGIVTAVDVQVNDRVQPGDVLARIDPIPFQIAVREAEAQLAAANATVAQTRAQAAEARRNVGRMERLFARDAVAQVEAEDARTQVDVADAQVRSALAQREQAAEALRRAQRDLQETFIITPIEGVVLRREVEPGMTVVSAFQAETLFVVGADLSRMTAEVDIDEADIVQVEVGQPATFTVTSWPDRIFHAVVARVDLAPDPTSTTVIYLAELHVDNRDLALRPGMTVTANIQTARIPQAILIPVEALRYRPEAVAEEDAPTEDHIWVLRRRRPEAVPIEVLGDDGTHAAVVGVAAGDLIIVGEAE